MRRIIGLVVVLLAVGAGSPPAQAENRALLIGVGQYQRSEANLPGIGKDLIMMKEVVELLGYKDSQIKVIRDSSATLGGIQSAIENWLIRGTTSNDKALFYYSGHGSQKKDDNGDEDDNADEVLMPHDTGVRNKQLNNVLVDDDFGVLLARIPADRVYVFLDACHSGTATKSFNITRSLMDLGETKPKFFVYDGMPISNGSFIKESRSPGDKYVALTAAADNQSAVSTPRGSIFTYGLWAAVKQASAEGKDLSMTELRSITDSFIARALAKTGKIHNPQLSGNSSMYNRKLGVRAEQSQTPVQSNSLREKLEHLVAKADYKLDVSLNKNKFRVGDELIITCRVNTPGYLNILNIGPGETKATVLFPNRLHQDNLVRANGQVQVPAKGDSFILRAHPPKGETLVVVLHTQQPLNTYFDGQGKAADLFKALSEKSYRSFKVEQRQQNSNPSRRSLGAAKIVTTIE